MVARYWSRKLYRFDDSFEEDLAEDAIDDLCYHFAQMCATDHQQDRILLRRILTGAEEVGGVDLQHLSRSYKLLAKVDLMACASSSDAATEELEHFFEKFEGINHVIYNGQKRFFLASESTPEKILQNLRNFMDETEQSSAGESDELNQQDEINLKIEPTFQKSSSSSSGFHEQWSCSDEWDFVNKKYRTTIYAKGTFPKRLISPPTPEELADEYDPWV